jgi:hypothetical protein
MKKNVMLDKCYKIVNFDFTGERKECGYSKFDSSKFVLTTSWMK